MHNFVFTCGDTNGIGPEIVLKTLNKLTKLRKNDRYYFICPLNIFNLTANKIKPEFSFNIVDDLSLISKTSTFVSIINSGYAKQSLGKPTITSGKSSFKAIELSFILLRKTIADAVITAPISKFAINKAGIKYSGHTEMYANWCRVNSYVMTFLSNKFNTALMTIHHPLKKVSNLIKKKKLENTLNLLSQMLNVDLDIKNPSLAVLGLNPHAGENGLIGTEEIDMIVPAVRKCSRRIQVNGPFAPDAFFANKIYKQYDLVLGMYHDQVLIPFKLLNSGKGVNYTAGLPIVRTSPDHGVAYDIAKDFVAEESSLLQAFFYAEKIVKNRKKNFGNRN